MITAIKSLDSHLLLLHHRHKTSPTLLLISVSVLSVCALVLA